MSAVNLAHRVISLYRVQPREKEADIRNGKGEVYSYKNGRAKELSLTPCSKSKYNPQGYLKCTLSMNNQHIYCMVHRLVAKYFVQGEFDGAVVNHKDGDTYNNSCTNLEWVTQKNNLLDANSRNSQTFTKWYYQWRIKGNNGYVSEVLNGQKEIKACINNNKLPCIIPAKRFGVQVPRAA